MNKTICSFLLCTAVFFSALVTNAIEITRVEPANWWTGMKNHSLQILIYDKDKDLTGFSVDVTYEGVALKEVLNAIK